MRLKQELKRKENMGPNTVYIIYAAGAVVASIAAFYGYTWFIKGSKAS